MAGSRQGNAALRQARRALKRTQEEIILDLRECATRLFESGALRARVEISLRQYQKWESANPPWPHPAGRRVLETFFRRPVGELGFTSPFDAEPTHDSRTSHPAPPRAVPSETGDPTNRRSALTLLGGTALTPLTVLESAGADDVHAYTRRAELTDLVPEDIESLERAVHHFDVDYSLMTRAPHSPRELWPVVAAHRHRASDLLHERRHTLREGRELAHHAGMLSVILAWLAHDTGRRDLIPALCADAWHHGRQAGDPEVCAWAEDVACTEALYADRPHDALTAATRGLAVAPRDGNAAIRLSTQLARAQARVGNREAFTEVAARARRHREALPAHGTGLFAVDAVRIVSVDATSHGWLGDHQRAHDAAVEAIHLYEAAPSPHHAPTRLAIARLDLALAQAALGEPEAAIATARRALDGSRLVQAIRDRAAQLHHTMTRRYPAHPEVRAFGEELHTLTTR
ncbi:XRE family transcriptional regulator [Streptomyces sp. URMC 129]|uniref:XRE family transcriptional regulator n=1 Tax=Streptomyces sp. URMC 129 TaxID=3423407 RepID=UPI003F1AB98A